MNKPTLEEKKAIWIANVKHNIDSQKRQMKVVEGQYQKQINALKLEINKVSIANLGKYSLGNELRKLRLATLEDQFKDALKKIRKTIRQWQARRREILAREA